MTDGDLILTHETNFNDGASSTTDMVIHWLDNRGILKWSKRLGSSDSNDASSVAIGSDGSIVILGRAKHDGTNIGLHLTKLDH